MDKRKKNIAELTNCTLREYRDAGKVPVTLFADNVRSMHNIGAMLRTCDAFAVSGMVMAGISGIPPHPEITKSALGAEESVDWRYVENGYQELLRLKEEGKTVAVLEQAHGSIPLNEFHREEGKEYVLVVGNEVEGVDQRIVDAADVILEIPQHGIKHSLNVSVSAGIALWQMCQ